jgi:hypothetical protein
MVITARIHIQLAYFGQYVTAFVLGNLAHGSHALSRMPKSWGTSCLGTAAMWFTIGKLGGFLDRRKVFIFN